MTFIENSTLGLTYGSLRTNLGVEKAGKLAFLFRQLIAEKLYSFCALNLSLQPYFCKEKTIKNKAVLKKRYFFHSGQKCIFPALGVTKKESELT